LLSKVPIENTYTFLQIYLMNVQGISEKCNNIYGGSISTVDDNSGLISLTYSGFISMVHRGTISMG